MSNIYKRRNFFIKKNKPKNFLKIIENTKNFAVFDKIKKSKFYPEEKKHTKNIISFIFYMFGDKIFFNKRSGVISRLDYETKGIFLFSKNDKFTNNFVTKKKTYITIGKSKKKFVNKEFRITKKGIKIKGKVIFTNNSINKTIEYNTKFKIVETIKLRNFFLYIIKCYFKRGKTHQIRISLKYKSIKIIGDLKYGIKYRNFNESNLHSLKLVFEYKNKLYKFKSKNVNTVFIKQYYFFINERNNKANT
ncbi:pseudouridine synthase [Candidatus Vidania fulgoroideorum]